MPVSEHKELRRSFAGSEAKDDIIRKIESGELCPGDSLLSTNDLARLYGLSYVTTHNMLRELVSLNYLERKNGQGTFVSSKWKKPCISSVGIPIRLQKNPFHVSMIHEISRQAMKLGISPIFGQGHSEPEFIDQLVQDGISAIIRFPGLLPEKEALIWRHLEEKNIKTVIINDFWYDGGPFASIRTDEESGTAGMVEHMISLGHKKIAFIDEDESEMRTGALNGFRQALWKNGIPFKKDDVHFLQSYGYRIEKAAQAILENFTAVFVTYDVYAIQLIDQFKKMGVVPGKDISIAGFDGIPDARGYELSTVRQLIPVLVERAFEVLCEDYPVPPKETVKPELIFDTSTGCAR